MNATLSWQIFANVPTSLRERISSVFIFGKNGDKLLFFTNPTTSRSTPLPSPVPNNTPMPTPSEESSSNNNNGTVVAVSGSANNNNPDIVAEINEIITNRQAEHDDGQRQKSEPEAYSIGKNTACCLATGDLSVAMVDTCKRVDALCGRKVVDVVAGERLHVMALTDDGHLLAWGENRNGQVGNGSFDDRVLSPATIFEPDSFIQNETVVQIAVGFNHSVCLTNCGKVYTWGTNDYGQMGDGTKVNKTMPVRVEGVIDNCNIVQIACCQRSTLALDNKGHVYQWGNSWNDNGVGLGQPVTRPQDVTATYPSFQNVRTTRLACGANHVLALAESGSVYAWGRNDVGQLGLGFLGDYGSKTREAAVLQPTKVSDFSMLRVRIKAILAYNQMNVSLAQSFSGVVFIWGRQSSTGSVSSRPVVTQFKTLEAAFISSCNRPITPNLQRIDHDQLGTGVVGAPNWLRQMFDHRPSSDLEVVVDGRSIYVHRTVLKMGSSHFRAMLDDDNGWKESKSPVIKIDKIPYAAYRAYLFYLYADELVLPPDVTQEDVVSLMDLASSYLEEDLKLKAVDYFAARWLDIENATAIYTLAVDHMLNELSAITTEFIFENLTAVVTSHSFSQIDAQHAKTIFIKAANRKLFAV